MGEGTIMAAGQLHFTFRMWDILQPSRSCLQLIIFRKSLKKLHKTLLIRLVDPSQGMSWGKFVKICQDHRIF